MRKHNQRRPALSPPPRRFHALDDDRSPLVERLRQEYEPVARHADDDDSARKIGEEVQLRQKVLDVQRRRVIEMRHSGQIDDLILRRIERDLDLQDTALANRTSGSD